MKLIISTYLRTLKERDEFDKLLPDLLNSMGIIPTSKTQRGTRQNGVDLSAIGVDPKDNIEKLFLFVLKQGDICRSNWDTGTQAVRPSLNEIFDVYLKSCVPSNAKSLPKKIVLGTTGDMKEEIQPNWAGYTNDHKDDAEFDFWGADEISSFIQKYLFNENLFDNDDRNDLRRTLALIGEPDYSLKHFYNILQRQLNFDKDGIFTKDKNNVKDIKKVLVRINLATRLLTGWADSEGNIKPALIGAERSVVWAWNLLNQLSERDKKKLLPSFENIWNTYSDISKKFLNKLEHHCMVRDGLSGYINDSSLFSILVFEIIGLISSIGISHFYFSNNNTYSEFETAKKAKSLLVGIIKNNSISNSPCFDENSIDITLAISLLMLMGENKIASKWLIKLVEIFGYTMSSRYFYPISTDNFDDLVASRTETLNEELFKKLTSVSWLIPTLAGWAVNLKQEESYKNLSIMMKGICKETTPQLWYPLSKDLNDLYFSPLHHKAGQSEAPIKLEEDINLYRERMIKFLELGHFECVENSPTYNYGYFGIDFIAYRHFRTLVPANYWYRFVHS